MNSDQETGDIMSGIDWEKLSLVLQSLTEINFRKTHHVLILPPKPLFVLHL